MDNVQNCGILIYYRHKPIDLRIVNISWKRHYPTGLCDGHVVGILSGKT
jgi:hypothetical protein